MLNDYIDAYVNAIKNEDTVTQRQIEKELATLGMDKYTLQIIANEKINGGK